jgi:hypothetical protein
VINNNNNNNTYMLIISSHYIILLQFHFAPTLNAIYVCMYVRLLVCFYIQTDTQINDSKMYT